MRLALLGLLALVGCSGAKDDLSPSAAGDCGIRPEIEGVCAGVPETTVCGDELCTADVACEKTWTVRDDASLSAATSGASAGQCIAFGPGNYGDVRVKGGVHLLGRGASAVTVRSVSFEGSGQSKVRGIGVVDGNVQSVGVALDLEQIAVRHASKTAIDVQDASLTVTQSTVEEGTSIGIALRCSDGCVAGKRPRLVLRRTWVRAQRLVGVLGTAIDGDFRDVVVQEIHPSSFLYGRGVELRSGSTIAAPFVRVIDCDDVGLAFFSSVGTLGPGLEVRNVVRGVVLQSVPAGGVVVDGFVIEDVSAVAMLVEGASRGVALRNGDIRNTKMLNVPVDVGGIQAIGDGVEWGKDAEMNIESSVRIHKSARRPAVIAPTAKGTFAATLLDGDEGRGVFVLDPSGPSSHPGLTIAPGIKVDYGDRVPVVSETTSIKP